MTVLAIAAVAVTALILGLLCIGDPKRRRTAGLRGEGYRTTARRAFAAAAMLPGLGLALMGDAAAFLVWIGAATIIGWLLAQSFNHRTSRRA